jgi:Flp pilus assembly protein TadG
VDQRGERGSILPFSVTLVVALVAFAALVVDGGGLLAARRKAASIASAAARRGSQEVAVGSLSNGSLTLDADRAVGAAMVFVRGAGASGTARVAGRRVVVRVSLTYDPQLVGALAGPTTVTAERSAEAFSGG